jgi:hypothetical protein
MVKLECETAILVKKMTQGCRGHDHLVTPKRSVEVSCRDNIMKSPRDLVKTSVQNSACLQQRGSVALNKKERVCSVCRKCRNNNNSCWARLKLLCAAGKQARRCVCLVLGLVEKNR